MMSVLCALLLIAAIVLLPIIGIVWIVLRLGKKDTWKTKTFFFGMLCLGIISLAGVIAFSCRHQWTAATCLTPKTCDLCQLTEGETGPHQWEDATCITPGVCAVCHVTDTAFADHDWQDATCKQKKTCKVCGEVTGEVCGCVYENGSCIWCGEREPLVWIPRTGEKYHSDPSCSGMDNPTEVPISEAIAQGFTECENCY